MEPVSGSAPGIQTAASGEPVTIASADGISKTGYTFGGGWIIWRESMWEALCSQRSNCHAGL